MSPLTYDPPSQSAFAAALQARLDAVVTVEAYILKPVASKPSRGYVWAQVGGVNEFTNRMSGLASDGGGVVILHCCGFVPAQAVLTDELVAGALRGWRWSADPHISPLRLTSVSEVITDNSVPTDVRYSITRMYRYDA